jgi:hypothetical protein
MAEHRFQELLAKEDETEAFAQILYAIFGGFVQWELLSEDGQSKQEYRTKARALLDMLAMYREHHGRVEAPVQPTPEMLEAAYRAMLEHRPARDRGVITPTLTSHGSDAADEAAAE